jgi:tRNA dimethylallyltransferase
LTAFSLNITTGGQKPPAKRLVGKENKQSVFAIVGPTASGKSELGIELALQIGGEIINCDSVQIYQEIEIATAKVPLSERRSVPHHLLDYVSPRVNYTAADWAKDATAKIYEIEARGNRAILVGGTGFYLRSLRQPFFDSPKTDENLREKLKQIRERKGAEHLHKILQRVDKTSAQRLFPRDYMRVQRGLEVFFQTGKPISAQQPNRAEPPEFAARLQIFALNPPRAALYERINRRAEQHFTNGLVEEVKSLREAGVPDDTNALGAHGYRRVVEYLRGERSLESAIEQTKLDVRHYAKRQLTWFRREEGVTWLDGFGDDPQTREKLFEILRNS